MKNTKIAFELLSVSRELLGSHSREASFNWSDYGAWISPDGDVVRVQEKFGHYDAVKEALGVDERTTRTRAYEKAFSHGWIRIAYFPELEVEVGGGISSVQRGVLLDMIRKYPRKSFVLENSKDSSYYSGREVEEAEAFAIAASVRSLRSSIHTRDYGVWILPDGKTLRVQKEYGHSDVARDFFIKEDSSFSEPPFLEASNSSWVRVALRPLVRVQIFGGLSSSQRSTLLDIIDRSTADEFFFEKGSINKTINDKEDAERFLRNAHSRKASFRWRDYGAWILPDGGVLRVKDVFDHFEVAKDYMEEHGIEVESKVYDTAFSLGWVRTVFLPNLGVEMRNGISSSQRSTLLEMVEAYPGERFNFERRNRSTGIEDKEEAVDFLRAASVSR